MQNGEFVTHDLRKFINLVSAQHCGTTVGLRLERSRVQLQAVPLQGNDLGQVGASVTKQYNLLPVAWQRCPATGKVTVGLASHWPCITDLSGFGLSTYGLKV